MKSDVCTHWKRRLEVQAQMLVGTSGAREVEPGVKTEQDQGSILSLKGQLGISRWPSVAGSSDFFPREAKNLDLHVKSPSF